MRLKHHADLQKVSLLFGNTNYLYYFCKQIKILVQFGYKDKKKLCIKAKVCTNNLYILTFIIQTDFVKSLH